MSLIRLFKAGKGPLPASFPFKWSALSIFNAQRIVPGSVGSLLISIGLSLAERQAAVVASHDFFS
jgi:hypothetical protein